MKDMKYYDEGYTRTSIRVNIEMLKKFEEYAKKNGMSRNSCMNMLMARYIKENELQNEFFNKLANSQNMADLINNLTPEAIELLKK